MLDNINEARKMVSSLIRYFDKEQNADIVEILRNALVSTDCINYDNWNGGIYTYGLFLEIEMDLYAQYGGLIKGCEEEILNVAGQFFRGSPNEQIGQVIIRPVCKQYLNWEALSGFADKKAVLDSIERQKNIMISVSTGGARIEDVNANYKVEYAKLDKWLRALGIETPNQNKDLWEWYGRWSSGDLPSYASRRTFIGELFADVVDLIQKSDESAEEGEYEPTGWDRVDRTIYEMKKQIAEAAVEEQFQVIGMLGRETIITAAQQVYDNDVHQTIDGVQASETDAKRMLEAYISYELLGGTNERIRKYAKSSLDLANQLTHDRTATKREASICLVSVMSLVNIVKIISRYSKMKF